MTKVLTQQCPCAQDGGGLRAQHYHAGMTASQRISAQNRWRCGAVQARASPTSPTSIHLHACTLAPMLMRGQHFQTAVSPALVARKVSQGTATACAPVLEFPCHSDGHDDDYSQGL